MRVALTRWAQARRRPRHPDRTPGGIDRRQRDSGLSGRRWRAQVVSHHDARVAAGVFRTWIEQGDMTGALSVPQREMAQTLRLRHRRGRP